MKRDFLTSLSFSSRLSRYSLHLLKGTTECRWSFISGWLWKIFCNGSATKRFPMCLPWRIAVNQRSETSFTRAQTSSIRVIAARYRVAADFSTPSINRNDFRYTSIRLAITIAKCVTRALLEIYTPEIVIHNAGRR